LTSRRDFSFDLPERLIAQYPSEQRGQSRLMTLDRATGERAHRTVSFLPQILADTRFLSCSGDKPLLVFNNTKVRKARLIGKQTVTGAEAEFLLLENLKNYDCKTGRSVWKTMVKRARRKKKGSSFIFFDKDGRQAANAVVMDAQDEFLLLEFNTLIDDEWLEKYGLIPLPPYIKRKDAPCDLSRYQTIYADRTGSTAAPTAGLHFTQGIMDEITSFGIESVFITLHVGAGTFLPVRSENIEDHVMHEELFCIEDKTAEKIEAAKKTGRKIIAVGTTSVRTLESAWNDGKLKRGENKTAIFIYPPYEFKVADALFTNFHTPESTLLMLVSAFAGRQLIMESYAEAVKNEYLFFSYGDAMFIY